MTKAEESGITLVACWSCKGPVAPRALFCSTCGALQPPADVDHFARLGLRRRYDLDPAELDRQYSGFQRRLHPDRFADRSAKERGLAQRQVAALNDAYITLKDPLKRASYLLRLAGRTADAVGARTVDDPALLREAMEMREALAEAGDAEAAGKVVDQVEVEIRSCQGALAAAFGADDMEQAARLTAWLEYLGKLAEDSRVRKNNFLKRDL